MRFALLILFAAVAMTAPATARAEADPPFVEPADPPRLTPKYDAAAACVRVGWKHYGGSGTCVACEGGKSLVVSNNHIFSDTRDAEGQFARGAYPLVATVSTLDGRRTLAATAVDGDRDADLAFLVVDGELPVAGLAGADAPAGTPVWHKGIGSGGGSGKVLPQRPHEQPKHRFASDAPSVSGDSGAGLFDPDGRLVAVNCGRHGTDGAAAQRGTPVGPVRRLLRGLARTAFPRLAADLDARRAEAAFVPAAIPDPPPVSPAGGAVEPKAVPVRAPAPAYETWLVNGQYVRVPAGQFPSFASPYQSCPNGQCYQR